jgi:hypothetical protein
METVCQACGYQRKPTDQAPDWACPSCGKAYAKTSHESSSPLVIYTDTPSAESSNPLHEGVVYQREPKETSLNKHGILIGALFSLLFLCLPVLVDPSSASAILLHSNIGSTALLFIALMPIAVIGRRMSSTIDSNDRRSLFALAATFFGLLFAVLFLGLAISGHNEARTQARIQRNGLRTVADVVRIYHGECGKGGSCSVYVEYTFTPSTEANPIHGYARIGSRDSDANVAYARTNRQIPIAYEADHPEVSAPNFNDDVFRLDHGESDRSGTASLGKIFLGTFVLSLAAAALSLWLRPGKKSNAR